MFSDNEDITLAGENPSAEAEDCGGGDETRERRIDLVHMNGLCECDFMTKGAFKVHVLSIWTVFHLYSLYTVDVGPLFNRTMIVLWYLLPSHLHLFDNGSMLQVEMF